MSRRWTSSRRAFLAFWIILAAQFLWAALAAKPAFATDAPEPPTAIATGQGEDVFYAGATRAWYNPISSGGVPQGWADASVTPFPGTSYTIPSFPYDYASNLGPIWLQKTELVTSISGIIYCHSSNNGWQLYRPTSTVYVTGLANATPGGVTGTDVHGSARVIATYERASDKHILFSDVAYGGPCPSSNSFSDVDTLGYSSYGITTAQYSRALPTGVQFFVVAAGGNIVYARYQTGTLTGNFNWITLGGVGTSAPNAVSLFSTTGALVDEEVFVRGTDNAMWVNTSGDSTNWSGWNSLGGVLTSGPGCSANSTTSAIYCFVVGTTGDVYMNHKIWPGAWSGWTDIGNPPST